MEEALNDVSPVGMIVVEHDIDNSRIVYSYSENDFKYVRGVVGFLSNIDGIKILLSNLGNLTKISIDSKNTDIPFLSLEEYINNVVESIRNGSVQNTYLNDDVSKMVNVMEQSIENHVNLAIAFSNTNDGKIYKIFPKGNEKLIALFNSNGLVADDNGHYIIRDKDLFNKLLPQISTILNVNVDNQGLDIDQGENHLVKDDDGDILRDGESKVHIYEKYIKDSNNQDVLVRLAVISQNIKGCPDIVVNTSYIFRDTLVTSGSVICYDDATNFYNNVLPRLVAPGSFERNISLEGKKTVSMNPTDSSQCIVMDQNGNYSEYTVNQNGSLIENLEQFEDGVDINELIESDEYTEEDGDYITFEEDVSNQNIEEAQENLGVNKKKSRDQLGKNQRKTFNRVLDPNGWLFTNSDSGNVTANALFAMICILVDMVAVVVGSLLLFR